MSEPVLGIAKVNPASGNGTPSARKRENAAKSRRREEHDTVSISDEAKRRLDTEASDDDLFDEG